MKSYIQSHPLISFFVLAYTISWISWVLFWQINTGYINGFEIVAALGPALSAMVISGILKPEQTQGWLKKRIKLFLLLLVIVMAIIILMRTWVMYGLVVIPGRLPVDSLYPSLLAFFIDLVGAASISLVISGIFSSRKGVRELLKTLNLKQTQTDWYWLVIAVAIYPAVIMVGNLLSSLLGIGTPESAAKGLWYWVAFDAALMSVYGLFFGGGFEEPGWRGFALPALHKKFSPLMASVILGPFWAFWHWPLFWKAGAGGDVFQMLFYSLLTIQLSVLLTTLYKWSKQSLPAVILFHSAINITEIYVPIAPLSKLLWILLTLLLAVWMWRRPEKFIT